MNLRQTVPELRMENNRLQKILESKITACYGADMIHEVIGNLIDGQRLDDGELMKAWDQKTTFFRLHFKLLNPLREF